MNVQMDHINVQLMLYVPIQLVHTSVLAILDLLVMGGMELTVALILMNVKIVISYVLNIICVLTQLGVTNAYAKKNSPQRGNFCQKAECPSGQYTPDGVTCNDCPVNTYNNIDDYSLSECSPCPTLHTTVSPGADSVTQCRSKMISTTSNLFIEKSNTALRKRVNTNFN